MPDLAVCQKRERPGGPNWMDPGLNGTELRRLWDQIRRDFASENQLNSVPFDPGLISFGRPPR